jgi:hypothetical protein
MFVQEFDLIHRLIVIICLFITPTLFAATGTTLPLGDTHIQVDPTGMLRLGTVQMELRHWMANSTSLQSAKGTMAHLAQQRDANGMRITGSYTPRKGVDVAQLDEQLTRIDAQTLRYRLTATTAQPSQGAWHITMNLPTRDFAGQPLFYDDQPVMLPQKQDGFDVFSNKTPQPVSIPLRDGMLTVGNASNVRVLDVRFYGPEMFSLLIPLHQVDGNPNQWQVDLTLHLQAYSAMPVDLTSAANMGFADQVSGDGIGGWTDEGAGHDLAAFPTGKQTLARVPFEIADPKLHDGKAAMVFAGPQRSGMLQEATLPIKPAVAYRYLYLAHAYAWDVPSNTPAGWITAHYADGSTSRIEVQTHRDMSNWWAPCDTQNGPVGWTAPRRGGNVGLNVTAYELDDKPLTSLQIQGSSQVVWMIAAMSLGRQRIVLPHVTQQPLVIEANKEWQPLTLNPDTVAGSVLDFSFLSDKPAGKFGRLQPQDDHLVFEKRADEPVRLWGTNLCFAANFPEKDTAKVIARRLVMMGYNTIRLHHFDGMLLADNKRDSYTFDLDQLDKIEYLVHCLKEQGLYVSFDLYCNRSFPKGEISEMSRTVRTEIKALIPVSDSAYRAWQHFARNLLTHVNPYTGMTWAADPAIIGICPVNENVLPKVWSSSGDVAKLYQDQFETWLNKQQLQSVDPAQRSMLFAQFLTQLQTRSSQQMRSFLKDELHVKAMLTDVNHRHLKTLNQTRQQLDYVDLHAYHDHPRFAGDPWKLPYMYHNQSTLNTGMELPGVFFADQMLGKPFFITEFNYSFPNPHRGESGVAMGAYAAFQRFDGLYRFNYTGRIKYLQDAPIIGLGTSTDPVNTMADRMIALLFARGDVQAAKTMIPQVLSEDQLFASSASIGDPSHSLAQLGLMVGTGTRYLQTSSQSANLPSAVVTDIPAAQLPSGTRGFADDEHLLASLNIAGMLPPNTFDPVHERYTSDTGEIRLDAKRAALSVVTPRSEAFVINDKLPLAGQCVVVQGDGKPQTMLLAAMDQQSLALSRRMLLLHVTDAQNTATKYADQDRHVLEAWGEAPVLILRGQASIALTLEGDSKSLTVWAIDSAGNRTFHVPVQVDGNTARFTINTVPKAKATTIAYEIIR